MNDANPVTPPPCPPASVAVQVAPQITRAFLWVCSAACAGGAALVGLAGPPQGHAGGFVGGPVDAPVDGSVALSVSLFLLLAVACLAATRLPQRWLGAAVTAGSIAASLLLGHNVLVLGWGQRAPALPLLGLLACMLCITVGWRAGALLGC